MAIMHTSTQEVERSGVSNEHAFTIKASAKSFQVLTSNLYSDKPKAIIRELVCNAHDSHVAAGKGDVPVELILPTRLSPTLTIRDNGVGLDHEGIVNVYTKFFESTKADSNDFVGQLGLGSKAPFSMFKSFNVEARKDGVKRLYTAYLNEIGVPTIALMSQENTTEPNGVSVSMAVKQDDVWLFQRAARYALTHFNPMPIVSGDENFNPSVIEYGLSGTDWKIRNKGDIHGAYVVQGPVAYPIESYMINSHINRGIIEDEILRANIDIWMPIGSVDVAPSREALSYDDLTINNIISKLRLVANEIGDAIQAQLDACNTAYEAGCWMYNEVKGNKAQLSSIICILSKTRTFVWKDQPVTNLYSIDCSKLKTCVIQTVNASKTKVKQLRADIRPLSADVPTPAVTDVEVTLDARHVVLINDVTKAANRIVIQHLNSCRKTAVMITPVNGVANTREINWIIKQLGNPPVKRLSELPYTPYTKVKSVVTKRPTDTRRKFTGFKSNTRTSRWGSTNKTFSRLTWENVQVDLTKGGFYIPMIRFDAVHNGRTMSNIDAIFKMATCMEIFTEDQLDRTYGFTQQEIDSAPAGWVNVFDYITTQVTTKMDTDAIVAIIIKDGITSNMTWSKRFSDRWAMAEPQLNEGLFKRHIADVYKYTNTTRTTHDDEQSNVLRLLDLLNSTVTVLKGVNELADAVYKSISADRDAMMVQYPMLHYIDSYYITTPETTQAVIDYVNLVDSKITVDVKQNV